MDEKTKAIKKLFGNRMYLEGNVIFSIMKNLDYFDEFPLEEKDFRTKDGKVLFNLAKVLSTKGIKNVDKTTLDSELSTRPEMLEFIDEIGGTTEVIKQMSVVNERQIEVFYDDLLKSNYLLELQDKGFDVKRYADKFVNANYEETTHFIEHTFVDTDVKHSRLGKAVNTTLLEFTDEIFDQILNGEMYETLSFSDYCPLLSSEVNGLVTGTTYLLSAPSNNGKSTFMLSSMVYPILKRGEQVLLISNEMTYLQYLYMLIPIVLVREFNYYKLTRKRMRDRKFTDQDIEMLRKAQEFINTELRHLLILLEFDNGSINVVKKAMRLYSKLGVKLAIYDNMKAENSANQKAWAEIIESGKELTFLARELSMNLLMPYQIAQSSEEKYNLSRADLAEGKGIITIVSVLIIFRKLKADEFDGCKREIKPYKWVLNNGEWVKEYIPLPKENNNHKYIVLTIDKNRFGDTDKHILYEFDTSHAIFREVGWCTPSQDVNYKTKG